MPTPANPFRLSDDVLPRRYHLTLTPHLEEATFDGYVEIDLDIVSDVDAIAINAVDLTFYETILKRDDGSQRACSVSIDEATERARISTRAKIPAGKATLTIRFSGILNDLLTGFYRSTYLDPDGVSQTIATSQMEATDARRAFPCFDEPAKKAIFDITLIVPEHLEAYSNSPIVSEVRPGDGTKIVSYAPTMIMSTYLVAFVVGPFEATDAIDVDGIPVRVVYPKGKADLAPFALEIAAFSLRYFSDYFAIAYPGDKLDLVAIPDFAFGAMENLGCVTFRETALLVDPTKASRVEVERVVDVVAHEIAHMWFGDLVTMDWWEGIWLNEAFATFMEIKCTDAFRPNWKRWVSFGISREMAMGVDGLHATRPIEFDVISPADARGMFDLLTYEKGGSVLRMLEQYLGEALFRDGIRRYLTKHSYANTVTNDLWDALEESSGEPVRDIMNTWILQGGHPVLSVEAGSISQSPFSFAPASGESSIGDHWQVPLLTRTIGGSEITRRVLGDASVSVAPGTIVNAGGWGVYRTAYGSSELAEIMANFSDLTDLEQATLVADTWAATQANKVDLADFLSLCLVVSTSNQTATWSVVTEALSTLNRIADDAQRPLVQASAARILRGKFLELGWDAKDTEDETIPSLRAQVIGALGGVGADDAIRSEALKRFDAGDLHGDLASAVVAIVASVGRDGDYEEIFRRFKQASDPQSEQRYLGALSAFDDPELTRRTFEACFSDDIRTQDAPYEVGALLANRVNGLEIFALLQSRWDETLQRFPIDAHSRMVMGIARIVASEIQANEIAAFLEANPLKVGQRTVIQGIERLKNRSLMAARLAPQLVSILDAFTA
jgi:puromycin-sensitive aminopeptidase